MSDHDLPRPRPLTFVHGKEVISTYPATFSLNPKSSVPDMSTESRLNQAVKGSPPSNLTPPPPAPLSLATSPSTATAPNTSKYSPVDPHLSALPSSPSQIYLNLLILESSLRAQYLHLLSRRRLNTFFLLLLALWNSLFVYLLFLRPREDGTGRGGSVYWFVETSERIALLGGVVTVLLVWATGQWERAVRWPRRWLVTTNRGLRGFNLRVVIVRGRWWREMLGHMAFLLPFGLWREAGGSDWNLIEHEQGGLIEEDLAPGGDHIMLLLQPKSFSPEFRENWEEYRADYWEKENERRKLLRIRVRTQKREKAKEYGGWRWWSGCWRLFPHHTVHHHNHPQHPSNTSSHGGAITKGKPADLEKHPHGHHHAKGDAAGKANRRRSFMRSESAHSRQSSRSATPSSMLEFDGVSDKHVATSDRTRRGSSSSVKRKKRDSTGGGTGSARNSIALSPLAIDEDTIGSGSRRGKGSRPSTPASEAGSIKVERSP